MVPEIALTLAEAFQQDFLCDAMERVRIALVTYLLEDATAGRLQTADERECFAWGSLGCRSTILQAKEAKVLDLWSCNVI